MDYIPQRRRSRDSPPDFSLSLSSTETEEQPCAQEASSVVDLTLTATQYTCIERQQSPMATRETVCREFLSRTQYTCMEKRQSPMDTRETVCREFLRNRNISAKYKDIISKSVLLHSGCPAVYQLKPKKQKIETLTKMTVGEKNPSKVNKTILLVGGTGSGKSTLINALFNYSMGVKWEDEVWFQIIEEETRSQTKSQTSDVIVYEIFGFEDKTLPYSLTIIDTPGYGDTRGTERDDIVIQRLFQLFGSDGGVHELHAVGLVMKASENRLTDRQIYIFNSVMSLFGKDVEKNIAALITYSDGAKPGDALKALDAANIKCARNEKNEPLYFLFNNRQKEERTEENEMTSEFSWKVTERGMHQFSSFMEKVTPENMKETVEVLKSRIRLTACIQNLQERIEFIGLKQKEIRQVQEALKKYEEQMKKNENFTEEIDEVYKVKEKISGRMWFLELFYEGATCCTVCEENCHHPGCTVAWYPRDCKVMKGGNCTSCTGKCHVSKHVKEEWIYVSKTRRVQKTREEMKKKYEENKSESEKKLSLLETLEEEMKRLTAEKLQYLEEAYQHVLTLEQIALTSDSASTYVHLDFLIEKMKEKGDTEKVQKLEKMKKQMDEATKSAVQYVWGQMKQKFKYCTDVMKKVSRQTDQKMCF